jgi:hypothetical protein
MAVTVQVGVSESLVAHGDLCLIHVISDSDPDAVLATMQRGRESLLRLTIPNSMALAVKASSDPVSHANNFLIWLLVDDLFELAPDMAAAMVNTVQAELVRSTLDATIVVPRITVGPIPPLTPNPHLLGFA